MIAWVLDSDMSICSTCIATDPLSALRLLLLKSILLHTISYFEESFCITFTYYLEIKVTSSILD